MTDDLFFVILLRRTTSAKKEAEVLKPVYRERLWNAVEVTVFGAVRNWNFAGETIEEIETRNPGVIAAVQEVMRELDIKRALVPKPAFNARVVSARDLIKEIFPNFFRGADADGAIITQPGDAYFLASADCLTAVLYHEPAHQLVGLHCGRNALVDRDRLAGKPARESESVIDAGIRLLSQDGRVDPRAFRAFLAAGIGPESFTHPTTETITLPDGRVVPNGYREANLQLLRHFQPLEWLNTPHARQRKVIVDVDQGQLDLVGIVQAQLRAHRVWIDRIEWDGHDTATDLVPGTEDFLFHSYRRDQSQRNLVVVKLLD